MINILLYNSNRVLLSIHLLIDCWFISIESYFLDHIFIPTCVNVQENSSLEAWTRSAQVTSTWIYIRQNLVNWSHRWQIGLTLVTIRPFCSTEETLLQNFFENLEETLLRVSWKVNICNGVILYLPVGIIRNTSSG